MKVTRPKLPDLKLAMPSRKIWLVAAGVVVVGLVALGFVRTQRKVNAALASRSSVQVKGPLKVDLNQDVAAGLIANIEPAVPGKWHEERTLLGVSAITFEPSGRFEAGRSYTLRINNLKRVATGAMIPDIVQQFTTQIPATITEFTPKSGAKDVPVNAHLSVTLSEVNHGLRQLRASLSPATALKLVPKDDKTFTWEPIEPLKQTTTYTFSLDDMSMPADKQRLMTSSFITVSAPNITSARTGGYFTPGQTIDIVFDQPMAAATDSFVFDTKGKGSWTDTKTYKYTPEGITPGKTYTYKVKAGIKSQAGGAMEAERAFQYATNGAVGGSGGTGGGSVGIGSSVRITFDQAVDHASAESRFSMNPAVGGKFSWSGNTLIYQPAGLAYQTGYSYAVAPGVVPVWGLPSARALGGAFTTEVQVIKLGVPEYKQMWGRSCELSSLRMLLAYRGIKVTDADILGRLNYNPRPRDKTNNVWENPNEGFVGKVDTFSWSEGYGVHAGPVAAAGRSFGRNATAFFGVSAAFIAGNIHAGNPVEFYGHISDPKADSWNTTSGVVQTTTSMHARVVYGVMGKPDAPVGFYIHDPWTGSSFYWTAAQLMANMNAVPGVSNQAVVVY